MSLERVRGLAIRRRVLRWEKEKAARVEKEAHDGLVQAIADWKKVSVGNITLSNIACFKAPADLHCTFVSSANAWTNPCVFCGGMERDIF